ncbi:MAG: hypothetical protein DRP35_03250 [Candidatus Zixiibacteriota bacterium]|nr:MAG: hypothetical protein DRP35_03250 [candidate division Zixibacteria bacterium]
MFLKRLFQFLIVGLIFCLVYSPVLSDNASALIRTTATVKIPTGLIPYSSYKKNSDEQLYASISDNYHFETDNNLFFLWQPSDEYVINFQIERDNEIFLFQINQDFAFSKKIFSSKENSSLNLINLNSIDKKLPFDYSRGIMTLISIDN